MAWALVGTTSELGASLVLERSLLVYHSTDKYQAFVSQARNFIALTQNQFPVFANFGSHLVKELWLLLSIIAQTRALDQLDPYLVFVPRYVWVLENVRLVVLQVNLVEFRGSCLALEHVLVLLNDAI